MNTISFTPSYSTNVQRQNSVKNKVCYTPSFKGAEQVIKKAKPNPILNGMKQLYGLFFTFGHGKVKSIKGGKVFTESVQENGLVVTSKKFNLFSRTPSMVVEDDYVMKLRKKTKINSNGTKNIEFRDMHSPEYKVSVGYEGVLNPKEYDGAIKIQYCDKAVSVSPQESAQIKKDFDAEIANNLGMSMSEMTKLSMDEIQSYLDKYFQNPNVIGRAILTSPESLERQLETVHSSMPYGIEAILAKMGK